MTWIVFSPLIDLEFSESCVSSCTQTLEYLNVHS